MDPIALPPTRADRYIASSAARHTSPAVQKWARAITWGGDEHVLCALAVGEWILSRPRDRQRRIFADHLLATVVTSSALPHLIKKTVDQERPDRCMVDTDRRGIQTSGKPHDAFPSGHAVHLGAVASALSWLYPDKRLLFWGGAGAIGLTRIAVLAHWASDVAAGLVLGAATEKVLRSFATRRLNPSSPAARERRSSN
jgi:membrane-associated phospholipid phosphatase